MDNFKKAVLTKAEELKAIVLEKYPECDYFDVHNLFEGDSIGLFMTTEKNGETEIIEGGEIRIFKREEDEI